jgi:hypothetical protein
METNTIQPQIGDFPFTGECQALVDAYHTWKNRFLDFSVDHPLESLITVVLGSAWVLYLAEKDVNEGIQTYDDALYYISTCLSVGFANVFPQTQLGKFVAAVVMMIGPSLSSWVVEGRLTARNAGTAAAPPPPPAPAPDLAPLLEKLDAILQELRAQRSSGGE